MRAFPAGVEQFSQADLPDTVEGHTKGVAEDIIAADEARRQEELVRPPPLPLPLPFPSLPGS